MDENNENENSKRKKPQEPEAQQQENTTASQSNESKANDNKLPTAAATSDNEAGQTQQQPGRPRPMRPNQFRRGQMVALAATGQQKPLLAERISTLDISRGGQSAVTQTLVGVPIEAQIELASGVLKPADRATMMPPKRPNYLPPARHPGDPQSAYVSALHHHRFQPTTSLGATALTSGANSGKPNRYSWAQMQQWHAAQSAAAAAAAAEARSANPDRTGAGGRPGGFHYHFSSPFSSAASRVLLVPNPIVNLSEHTKSRLVKFIEAIKRFSEKWFSHVLLLMFLASYACLGAYIFISFEAPNEQWEKQMIIETRLRIVNESYDQAHEASSREEYVDLFKGKFEEYERLLNRVCQSGMTSSSLENQWTFWGALFYSMTVFTTIGYGQLTPITFAGRVATMIYAIFGIPILLMVLADLGKLLTRIIKYAFKKFRYWYNKLLGRKASVRTRQIITDNTNQYIGQARHAFERGFATYIQPYQSRIPSAFRVKTAGHQFEQQQHRFSQADFEPMLQSSDVIVTPASQSKPVSPQTPSAFGNDPKKPPQLVQPSGADSEKDQPTNNQQQQPQSQQHHKTGSNKKSSRKISTSNKQQKHSVTRSASASNIGAATGKTAVGQDKQTKRASLDQQNSSNQEEQQREQDEQARLTSSAFDLSQDEGDMHHHLDHDELAEGHEEGEFVEELDDDLDIPVSFALFLLITYMMFGAVVFSIWESWNFFDSLYFVFISMSTIGFGDLVPQHPKRMIGT